MSSKAETLTWLKEASLDEPVSGAIESLIEGGGVSEDMLRAIRRFVRSSNIENRLTALTILVDYAPDSMALYSDIVALLIAAFVHDDDDVKFGAIGMLSSVAAQGCRPAASILDALKTDLRAAEDLQLY